MDQKVTLVQKVFGYPAIQGQSQLLHPNSQEGQLGMLKDATVR